MGGIAWSACRGWTDEARGFPCGLWLLFHTLVAHATDFTAADTLKSIRAYVKHFFGCESCAQHFVGMADDQSLENIGSVNAAALWMWRTHNAVNLRLNLSGNAAVLRYGLPKLQALPEERCECVPDGYGTKSSMSCQGRS